MCFSLKFWIFLNSASSAASAGFLPALFVYTHCHRGRTEKGQSPGYFKIFGKNTTFNEHPVHRHSDTCLFNGPVLGGAGVNGPVASVDGNVNGPVAGVEGVIVNGPVVGVEGDCS